MLLSRLVPPKEMYKYCWYVPLNHQDWYYYTPRNKISYNSQTDLIYKTLDDNLKKLFKLVSSKRYLTLPSCEGHFHTEKSIKSKYNSIIKDFIKITTDNLLIQDIESTKKYHYSNINHQLPWNSFEKFKDEISKNMSVGYFGIVNPIGSFPKQLDAITFDLEKDGSNQLLHITVNNSQEKDIEGNWDKVFYILKNHLK